MGPVEDETALSLFPEAISTWLTLRLSAPPNNFLEVTDGYRLTSNLLSTQDSSLRWSKRMCLRSVSGPDTTPPTSSSDGSDAPSRRSQTFTDASTHCKFVFFHKIPVYVCFRVLCTFFFFLHFFYCEKLQHGTKHCSLNILSSFNKQLRCFHTIQTMYQYRI